MCRIMISGQQSITSASASVSYSICRRKQPSSVTSSPSHNVMPQSELFLSSARSDGIRCTWIVRACVALLPGSPDPAQDRRIDDEPAERLDKRHVERGEPGHGLHIDRPVETISTGSLCKHGRQEG